MKVYVDKIGGSFELKFCYDDGEHCLTKKVSKEEIEPTIKRICKGEKCKRINIYESGIYKVANRFLCEEDVEDGFEDTIKTERFTVSLNNNAVIDFWVDGKLIQLASNTQEDAEKMFYEIINEVKNLVLEKGHMK